MLRLVALSLTLVCASPFSGERQAQPVKDHAAFSGKWTAVAPVSAPYLGWAFGLTRVAALDFTSGATVTIEYLTAGFEVTRSVKLDGSATGNALDVLFAPGMDGVAGRGSTTTSTSSVSWLKDKLRVVTTIVVQPARDPNSPFPRQTRKVEVRDTLALDTSGRLVMETQTSSGGGAFRTTFTRATAADEARLSDARAAFRRTPAVTAERQWLGAYRFGMTAANVRRIEACPKRDYRIVGGPGLTSLICRHFPLDDLEVNVQFVFERDGLASISITGETPSEKDARHATEVFLSYLEQEVGQLSSLDVASRPLTATAIWEYLDAHPASRNPETVTVTTGDSAWPVILTAQFRKENTVSLTIRHTS